MCVCGYGDVVILPPDSELIYGIDLDGKGQVKRGEGGCAKDKDKWCVCCPGCGFI